jgi:hypothetical protein
MVPGIRQKLHLEQWFWAVSLGPRIRLGIRRLRFSFFRVTMRRLWVAFLGAGLCGLCWSDVLGVRKAALRRAQEGVAPCGAGAKATDVAAGA